MSYGQTFEWKDNTYKIVDLNPKAPKYPIIAENTNGVLFKFEIKCVLPETEA